MRRESSCEQSSWEADSHFILLLSEKLVPFGERGFLTVLGDVLVLEAKTGGADWL